MPNHHATIMTLTFLTKIDIQVRHFPKFSAPPARSLISFKRLAFIMAPTRRVYYAVRRGRAFRLRSERVFFQLKRIKTALCNRLIKLATSTYLEKLIIVHIASMGLPQRVDFKRHDEEGADVLFHPHPP
jgi:hypothetical protein